MRLCVPRYRFLELYYHRRETGRVQTVVIYLPDIRSCLPTAEEWQTLRQQYKTTLEGVLDHQNHNSSKARNSNSTGSSNGESAAAKEEAMATRESPGEEKAAKSTVVDGAAPEAMETNAEEEVPVAEAEAGAVDKAVTIMILF